MKMILAIVAILVAREIGDGVNYAVEVLAREACK